jgi:hypothetical protein
MAELKGIDAHGNDWKLSICVTNPRYTNRYELVFSFNGVDFPIRKYSTYQGALETWSFLKKLCKYGTNIEDIKRFPINTKDSPNG